MTTRDAAPAQRRRVILARFLSYSSYVEPNQRVKAPPSHNETINTISALIFIATTAVRNAPLELDVFGSSTPNRFT